MTIFVLPTLLVMFPHFLASGKSRVVTKETGEGILHLLTVDVASQVLLEFVLFSETSNAELAIERIRHVFISTLREVKYVLLGVKVNRVVQDLTVVDSFTFLSMLVVVVACLKAKGSVITIQAKKDLLVALSVVSPFMLLKVIKLFESSDALGALVTL